MTQAPSQLASRSLAAEVKKKVRERGLVVWLDADGSYAQHVDALATGELDFSYPVVTLRGSYLELMLALERFGNGLEPEHLLVHLPGLNKDTVKETPVYELCAAGTVFEKNLGTLVREASVGVARPEEVDALVRAPGLSLVKADAWLDGLSGQPLDGLSLLTQTLGIDGVVLALLAGDKRFAPHLPEGGDALLAFLERGLGIDAAWRRFRFGGDAALQLENVTELVASWLMAVEFVHDLKEPPATPALRPLTALGPFAKESLRLAARFREQLPDAYEELANGLETLLADDRTGHHAKALGATDTFRFEEATTRSAAIDALRRGDWDVATQFAKERTPEQSFWVKRSPALQRTWEILRLAAVAGSAFAANGKGLERCASLEEAMQRYADKLAPVDRAHRIFEQRAHALVAPDLEDYDALLDVRTSVRGAYRAWSDGVNRAFFALCVARGPLPDRAVRQRFVYEDVVHPLIQPGVRAAFFMVDALRFEMAQGLAEELKRDKYRVTLGARLAELPTVTAVGMNALAPVAGHNGHLRVVMKGGGIAGFTRGEFQVCEPTARVRAMSERSLHSASAVDVTLDEFQDMSLAKLKRRLHACPSLVIVRSRELDDAGENNLHLGTFDQSLALVKTAISLLSQAGVERFVISSDHGFLLQDPTVENVPFGASKRVPERRHALLDSPSGMANVLEVRLSALDYDADDDRYLVFAPDTALWKKQEGIAPFVHGGNSLQERVIPVLAIERGGARGKTTSKYEVVARAEPAHLGRQRLQIAVRLQNRETATLGFLAPKTVSLALRVQGRSEVAITLLDAQPPAVLAEGRVLVPPNRDELLVEFELAGEVDERVRVEVFHPEAIEDVTPKVVEGFFDVARSRGRTKLSLPPGARDAAVSPSPSQTASAGQEWAEQVADDGFRKVLEILAERRVINEAELQQVLGSPMRVRAFARSYDKLVLLLPFEVEVLTVNGMKAYARKD
jgi:hypothetical protein